MIGDIGMRQTDLLGRFDYRVESLENVICSDDDLQQGIFDLLFSTHLGVSQFPSW